MATRQSIIDQTETAIATRNTATTAPINTPTPTLSPTWTPPPTATNTPNYLETQAVIWTQTAVAPTLAPTAIAATQTAEASLKKVYLPLISKNGGNITSPAENKSENPKTERWSIGFLGAILFGLIFADRKNIRNKKKDLKILI